MPETASRRHLLLQAPLRLLLQLWSGSCRMPTSTPERPLVHGCVYLIRSRSEIVKLHGLVGRTLWAPFVRPFSCTELEKNKQLNCKLSRSLCTNLVTALLSTELACWLELLRKTTSKPGRAVENRRSGFCVVALLKPDQNQRWDDHPHDRILKIHMHS